MHIFVFSAHFPGWEAKWDEWITRGQIRWPKPLDYTSEIDIGDHVEVLLESTRVPSVWMEGEVKKVTIDIDGNLNYIRPHNPTRHTHTHTLTGIELFLVTGMKRPRHIWVRRENLRLNSKRTNSHKECVPCFPSLFSGPCSSLRPQRNRHRLPTNLPVGGGGGPRCTTM